MASVKSEKCNLCGSNHSDYLFTKNFYPIVRCRECGLTYAISGKNTYLEDYYNEGYFKGERTKYGYVDYYNDKEYLIYNFKRYWKKIEKHINSGRVLDVGCATGLFLECAGSNWQRYGLEVSKHASKIAQDSIGSTIETCQLLEVPWQNESFDLITMWDVLDHLSNPLENLLKCCQLLKTQGIFILNVGDISALFAKICGKRWYIMIPPTHLYFFNKRTITALLNKAGFEILKIERPGKLVPLKLCFFRLSYIFDNALINAFSRYLLQSRLGNIKIYYNFYDVMTIYSQKKCQKESC